MYLNKFKSVLINLALLTFSLFIAILICEAYFYFSQSAPQLFYDKTSAAGVKYDSGAGWVPVFDNQIYDNNAIKIDKSFFIKGKKRILFLGDSVTASGVITDPISRYTGGEFELLNAGVPGYDINQEVSSFLKNAANTHPDLVVLMFHQNDYETGIAVVKDRDLGIVVANSLGNYLPVAEKLFWSSRVYQFILQSLLRLKASGHGGIEKIKKNILILKNYCESNKIKLLVVTLPWFKWPEDWTEQELFRKDQVNEFIISNNIKLIDGYKILVSAQNTIKRPREFDPDIHHPSFKFADYIAEFISKEISGSRGILRF